MKKLILLPTLAMFACVDTGKEGDSAEDTSTDTEETDTEETDTEETDTEEEEPAVEAVVTWGTESVDLAITNGSADGSYFWGIAETNGDCLTSEWGCWTGEDCYVGFDELSYCHPVDATGGSLAYGAAPDEVVEGTDTVFSNDTFSSITTHIIDDQSSADAPCWIWGADTSYYSEYSKTCSEM